MALNLYSLVKNPFSKNASIDEKLTYEICYEFARLGDDLIDLELEYIERIINKIKSDPEEEDIKKPELDLWIRSYDKTKAGRRIGLGITALADMVAALGASYDSKKGMTHFENVMRIKMRAELDCLIDLAILRGAFDGWDREKEFPSLGKDGVLFGNDFYRMLWEVFPEQSHRMDKFGRRSVSWSTIAPTGSVSILAQTSSGCEPLFQPFYMRRKKINPSEQGVVVDFVDETGDSWQEFPVMHEKFKLWCIEHLPSIDVYFWGKDILNLSKEDLQRAFELSPWYGSTANDIDWIKRTEIQAILQKYTTNAISSTINLPSTVTEREVSDIYFQGWKMGLKGQTVYVDGSRSGVLVNEPAVELVTFNENHAPKRPKSLSCKVVRFNNNKEKWIAFVGLLDNKPYEVFTGKLENVDLPNSVEIGEIKKVKDDMGNKRYDFIYDNGVVENISGVITSDYWNYGKLISGMLRHGMPLHFVVDTIQSLTWDDDHINTWKAGIARALKKFIKDGKAVGLVCKDCGSDNIIFEEGCNRCLMCGSSKCS